MASLDSARAKIEWAYAHLKLVKDEAHRYFDEEPPKATAEVEPDTNRVLRVSVESPGLPPGLSPRVGDCLQNLRSSLDYLVWELVLAAKGTPNKNHMFPICKCPDDFKSQLGRGRLANIPEDATTEVERLQPYNGGESFSRSNLFILDELTNINKHRRLVMARWEPLGLIAGPSGNFGDNVGRFLPVGEQTADASAGLVLMAGQKVEMPGKLIHHIVFDEEAARGLDVLQTLGEIGFELSERIIPKFERFFS